MDSKTDKNCTQWLLELNRQEIDYYHPCVKILRELFSDPDTEANSLLGPASWLFVFVQIFDALIFVTGLIGNLFVVYMISRYKKENYDVIHTYVLNLSVVHIVFLIGLPFLMTTTWLGNWVFGNFLCKAYYATTMINQIGSALFILVLSVDRLIAVCMPGKASKWRVSSVTKCVVAGTWILIAILIIPVVRYSNVKEMDNKQHCNVFWPNWNERIEGQSVYFLYSVMLAFVIPLPVIFVLNSLVILKQRRLSHASEIPNHSNGIVERDKETCDNTNTGRQLKFVLAASATFFGSWAPYWAIQVKFHMSFAPEDLKSMEIWFLLAGCLCFISTTFDPILYAYLSEDFQKNFKEAFSSTKNKRDYRPPKIFITETSISHTEDHLKSESASDTLL